MTTSEVGGLQDGTKYYLALHAYNADAALSPISLEVVGTTAGASSGGGDSSAGETGGGETGGGETGSCETGGSGTETASETGSATLKLQWNPPTDGATVGYVVWYGIQPGNYANQTDVGYVTTYDVAGLAENTKYYFAVQAYNANSALSPLSLEVSGTTAGTTTGGGETGEGGSGTGGTGSGGSTTPTPGTLKLQWDSPVDSATVGYLEWYGTAPGTYTNQTNVGFVTSTSISGLLDGTKYYFAIQAYNVDAALSPMSLEVSGTTSGTSSGGTGSGGTGSGGTGSGGSSSGGTTSPGKGKGRKPRPTSDHIELAVEVVMNDAPRNLKATVLNGKSVRLEWDAALDSSGTTGYLIEAGTGPGRSDLGVISTSALALTSPALPNGTYFVRVRGVTAAGPGSISHEVLFQIGSVAQCTTIPASPIFVASTRGRVVTLSWRPGAGEAPNGYVLDVGTAVGRHDIATLQLGPETTTFSSPAPAGSYWFRLTRSRRRVSRRRTRWTTCRRDTTTCACAPRTRAARVRPRTEWRSPSIRNHPLCDRSARRR